MVPLWLQIVCIVCGYNLTYIMSLVTYSITVLFMVITCLIMVLLWLQIVCIVYGYNQTYMMSLWLQIVCIVCGYNQTYMMSLWLQIQCSLQPIIMWGTFTSKCILNPF